MQDTQQVKLFFNSHKYKLSFLPIPKNGSTTIQQVLNSSQRETSDSPLYESFMVIRTPLDRIISGYYELIKRGIFKGSFNQLIETVDKIGCFDPHIAPQNHYYLPVDQLLFFDGAFNWLNNRLNVEIPHHNKGETPQNAIKISEDLFNRVYRDELEFYAKIYQKLKY